MEITAEHRWFFLEGVRAGFSAGTHKGMPVAKPEELWACIQLKVRVRWHDGSWWVYNKEHDSDTGPYATEREAYEWIGGVNLNESPSSV